MRVSLRNKRVQLTVGNSSDSPPSQEFFLEEGKKRQFGIECAFSKNEAGKIQNEVAFGVEPSPEGGVS